MIKITKRAKPAAIAVSSMAVARFARSQDDPTSRLILAIQKPRIAATGTTADAGNYATVEFNSGPNAGGQYSIQCYGVADPDAAPRSCAELEGVAPEASVAPQDLPKLYGTVSNDVTGLFSETVDCYVWADGVTGLVDKCQWMGRTDGPWDAYIANNGVTVRCPGIELDGTFVLDGVEYTRRDRAGLDALVNYPNGITDEAGLATSCTTGVTNMAQLFGIDAGTLVSDASTFNPNLSSWDTAVVTTMLDMFRWAEAFNQDLSSWNTSEVLDMRGLFEDATAFNNGDPGNNGANPLDWDTSKVTDMSDMFRDAEAFNQYIGGWNTGAVTEMDDMFRDAAAFNQYIGGWNTGEVTDMDSMFHDATSFNNGDPENNGAKPLEWDTSKVTEMNDMFWGAASFNQDVSSWNTGMVDDMDDMFRDAVRFNNGDPGDNEAKPLNWADTSQVTDMDDMFRGAEAFNQYIGGWNTREVVEMRRMFEGAGAFNQDISDWAVAQVTYCADFCLAAGFGSGAYLPALSGCGSLGCSPPP